MTDPASFSYGFAAGAGVVIAIFLIIAFWPVKDPYSNWKTRRPWP